MQIILTEQEYDALKNGNDVAHREKVSQFFRLLNAGIKTERHPYLDSHPVVLLKDLQKAIALAREGAKI